MFKISAYEDIDGSFTREDVKVNDQLFEEAITGLIQKGLVEVRNGEKGEIRYRLTPLGIVCTEHLFSNPKERN
jgi:predicted transcriptional regulator